MKGMSARSNDSRKRPSSPAGTTSTPVAPLPGLGLARSTASLATSFDVPPPMETDNDVAAITASRIRAAVAASGSLPYNASVPPRSRYHSSMLAPSTLGAYRSSIARIWRLLSEQARRGTGTHMASGQRRSARAMGIADRTPNFRASYDAEHTTPRLSR